MLEISRENVSSDKVLDYTKEDRFIKLPMPTVEYSKGKLNFHNLYY